MLGYGDGHFLPYETCSEKRIIEKKCGESHTWSKNAG